MSDLDSQDSREGIAVIGMSGRFPGAKNLEEFWRNLRDGVESISFFTKEELESTGVDPAHLESSGYVRAGAFLDEIEMFDAAFFGFSPREAEIMDPQYRFFITQVWQALEHSGYNPQTYQGSIGIFGGMNFNQYLLHNLLSNEDLLASEGALQLRILNDKDFLVSLVAYKLNLKGPSVTVQTACSTSLVAVNLACMNLLNYQCDIALAAGVSINAQNKSGYFRQEGVYSADGHCRPFDARAGGTLSGDGVGVVVLKRLAEAIEDGDFIHAVIKGSAINNDGALKVGYTAPSVDGQAEVIAMAQAYAGVDAETISFIEAHGTATPMGDPIEVAALTQVFRSSTNKTGFCGIGSVKSNFGHLDAAAGMASLIKTILSLKHKALPPTLHYTTPNPQIDFANSPFYVNAKLTEWKTDALPRRAGVSAFAVGGVNAHVIVEEAPAPVPSESSKSAQLLVWSAKSEAALEKMTGHLADALKQPELNLADVAYTLAVGRAPFEHRRALVCQNADEALKAIETRDPQRVLTSYAAPGEHPVTFMFPGLGNHYVNMGLDLYRSERVFREEIDRCCELLRPLLGLDLREVIYPAGTKRDTSSAGGRLNLRKMLKPFDENDEAAQKLNQTWLTQPALFVIEYALAKLWMAWGVYPQVMIGYSIGEYVAACLAGVFSLEDGLTLVAQRAKMIQELPGGSMLAVPLSESEVQPLLSENISLAAINGPSLSVVAGPVEEISGLEKELSQRGLVCRRLATSHAFHSKMMAPIVAPFTKLVQSIELKAPQIPFISNVTGKRITPAQATDPGYWATHLCEAVQFAGGISELLKTPRRILLEVGPGQVLGAWALQHPANQPDVELQVVASLRHSYDSQSDVNFLLNGLAGLWLSGVSVDWPGFYANESRGRVPLPTYPFEPRRYWVNPKQRNRESTLPAPQSLDKKHISDWFYVPIWKQSKPDVATENDVATQPLRWLLFMDELGIGAGLVQRLEAQGHGVFTVRQGQEFARLGERDFVVNAGASDDYQTLLKELPGVDRIVHLWSVLHADGAKTSIEFAEQCQQVGFNSLLLLAQAIGNHTLSDSLHLDVISNNMQDVFGETDPHPAKATLLGPCKVIPQEYPNVTCRSVDLIVPAGKDATESLIDQLDRELAKPPMNAIFCLRGAQKWQRTFESISLNNTVMQPRDGGVYLITGGVGGIGFSLAKCLAQAPKTKLVLTGRSPLPEREQWTKWLATHDESDGVSRKIRKAQALEQMGAEVWMLSADVTDRDAMQAVITQTRERFGEINGVVHAAGVSPGGLMQVKSTEMAAGVLDPKIKGTMIIEDLLHDVKLDFFVLCSSLVAITGGVGMVDHCGANAFLDAFAHRHAASGILSLNWDAWLEEGQAANATLSAGLKDLLHASHANEIEHPLLDHCLVEDGRRIYVTRLSTAKHWVLDEHRIMGHAVFPGTAFLEMVRAAFELQAPKQPMTIERVLFRSPLIVKDGEEQEIRTIIEEVAGQPGRFSFVVVSKGKSQEQHEHVSGEIESIPAEPLKQHQLQTIAARCDSNGKNGKAHVHDEDLHLEDKTPNSLGLTLGPRWQNLVKQVNSGEQEGLAYLELSEEFAADLQLFGMHPSLLDHATGLAQLAGRGQYLPLAYESLRIYAPLPAKIYSHVKHRGDMSANNEIVACDISILDENGSEVLAIKDYTLKRINGTDLQVQSGEHSQVAGVQDRPQGANDGIFPLEGAEVFSRVLSFRGPQLAVSIKDLPLVIEQNDSLTAALIFEEIEKLQAHRAKHPRPNLQTPYVEPRNELETTLVTLWQDILGLEQVGIYDNFFGIGGDSLLATQLISRVSKTFKVDLPLRAVFEGPTAFDLGVSITQRQAEQLDSAELEQIMAELEALPD